MPGIFISAIFLISIDILSFLTLRGRRIIKNKLCLSYLKRAHIVLSLLAYFTFLLAYFNKSGFAENSNINRILFLGFLLSVVWLPRILIIIFWNLGHYISKISANTGRIIIGTGNILSVICIILVIYGTFIERFKFDYREVEISYNNLPESLEGFKIVHVSDMHLSSFHRHGDKLQSVADSINSYKPDIIINTGDFVSFAWNEMMPFAEILANSKGKYGKYAIPGNHDIGSYHPYYSEEDKKKNIVLMDSLITAAGYIQVKDSSMIIDIDSVKLKIAGIVTSGTVPDIVTGDPDIALAKSHLADFTILMSHDPNHWYYKQEDNNVELTLSGHTHGMQLGIEKGRIKWSPAALLYPAWGGLYGENNNFLYVNRGLGTISLPYRIGMPPEVTVITLIGT